MTEVNSKKESDKLTLFISFLSGKGGAGKTSVSLSIAKLLSFVGYRVLFVDLDLQTHGASYFFTDTCDAQHKRGILELLQEMMGPGQSEEITDITSVIVKLSENWDFVPSKKIFKEKTWELSQNIPLVRGFIDKCIRHLGNLDYDFIIVDTQAGPAASTREACIHSQKAVIVSEPDPISVAASRSLDYEMHEDLPEFTRFLVNKLNTEEIRSFRAIREYLTIFEHLSPLPFDFGVRKSFSLRKIPIDTETPSPFLFGLITLSKEVIPTAAERLTELETKLRKSLFGDIREKRDTHTILIDDLSSRIQQLRNMQVSHEGMLRKRIAIMMSTVFITVTAILMGYLIFTGTTKYTFIAVAAMIGMLASIFPILFERLRGRVTTRRRMLDLEIENIQDKLQSLRREKEKYEGLLLEKSEKFMVEPE